MIDRVFIPIFQFRLNSIITYAVPDRPFKSSDKSKENLKSDNRSSGIVSPSVKKRIAKAVTLLIMSTPKKRIYNPITHIEHDFKLGFLTLTMPKQEKELDAKYCNKNLLTPMLLHLKRKSGVKSYIWKLEYQKNGTVHYHLTIDSFIDLTTTRNHWNSLLRKNGILDNYHQRYKNWNPNSIDIHTVKRINNIEAYLTKYLAKEDQSKKSNSKIWDCSDNLKSGRYFEIIAESKHYTRLTQLVEADKVVQTTKDNFNIYQFKSGKPSDILTASEKKDYIKHVADIRK